MPPNRPAPDSVTDSVADTRPPLTPAQQFAIAGGGHLTVVNEASFNALETGMSPEQHASLPDWWGITNRDTALGALNGLLDSGHRDYYRLIVEVLDNFPPDEWDRQLRAVRRQHTIHRDLVQYKNNLLLGFRELRNKGFLGPDERVEFVSAYDYSRAINVARWCHDLGYITTEETWQVIMQSAKQLQYAYSSWRDMGAAYLLGRYMWGANEFDMSDSEAAIRMLLTDPNSPWQTIDWKTPLD